MIENVHNPRVEAEEHYYNAKHTHLLDLGLEPHLLSETLIDGLLETVRDHADDVDRRLLYPNHSWREGLLAGQKGAHPSAGEGHPAERRFGSVTVS